MLYMFLCFLSCQLGYSADDNRVIFETYPTSGYNQGVQNAVKSSVVIECFKEGDAIGKGSGNYLQEGSHKFVLTANHVVAGCEEIRIINRFGSTALAKVKYSNKENDVAVIVPEGGLHEVKPVHLKLEKRDDILGEKIYFMGHPDELNFFLFEGMVAMETEKDIFLHSTAWGGVSGAVIFNRQGKVIGVASAVKVVISPVTGIPRLLEDLVLVSTMS